MKKQTAAKAPPVVPDRARTVKMEDDTQPPMDGLHASLTAETLPMPGTPHMDPNGSGNTVEKHTPVAPVMASTATGTLDGFLVKVAGGPLSLGGSIAATSVPSTGAVAVPGSASGPPPLAEEVAPPIDVPVLVAPPPAVQVLTPAAPPVSVPAAPPLAPQVSLPGAQPMVATPMPGGGVPMSVLLNLAQLLMSSGALQLAPGTMTMLDTGMAMPSVTPSLPCTSMATPSVTPSATGTTPAPATNVVPPSCVVPPIDTTAVPLQTAWAGLNAAPLPRAGTLASLGSMDSLVEAMLVAGVSAHATDTSILDGDTIMSPVAVAGAAAGANEQVATIDATRPAQAAAAHDVPAPMLLLGAVEPSPPQPPPLATPCEAACEHTGNVVACGLAAPVTTPPTTSHEAPHEQAGMVAPTTAPSTIPENLSRAIGTHPTPGLGTATTGALPAHGAAKDMPDDTGDTDSDTEPAKKKMAHARYMRFWRSVQPTAKKTPASVIERAIALKGKRGALTAIFEDWMQSKEDWGSSCLMQRVSRSKRDKCRGRFRLMTRAELMTRYGDAALVEDLCARKVSWLDHNMRVCCM